MQALHMENKLEELTNSDSLLQFVNESLAGTRPKHWLSEKPKTPKHSTKVVGDSLKAHVFDTQRDALMLIYHPVASKNRGIKERFESLASNVDSSKLLVARYNGVNESAVFKNPNKLPAIVHFTSSDLSQLREESGEAVDAPFGETTSRLKECVEYQFTRNHMLQSSSDEAFKAAMQEFIQEQTPKADIFTKQ